MSKYLTLFLGFIAAIFAAFGYREKAKRETLKTDLVNAEKESLSRQSEALLKKQRESNEKINQAKHTDFDPNSINKLFDD